MAYAVPARYCCPCSNLSVSISNLLPFDSQDRLIFDSLFSASDSGTLEAGNLETKSIEQKALCTVRSVGSGGSWVLFHCVVCSLDVFAIEQNTRKVVANRAAKSGEEATRIKEDPNYSSLFGLVLKTEDRPGPTPADMTIEQAAQLEMTTTPKGDANAPASNMDANNAIGSLARHAQSALALEQDAMQERIRSFTSLQQDKFEQLSQRTEDQFRLLAAVVRRAATTSSASSSAAVPTPGSEHGQPLGAFTRRRSRVSSQSLIMLGVKPSPSYPISRSLFSPSVTSPGTPSSSPPHTSSTPSPRAKSNSEPDGGEGRATVLGTLISNNNKLSPNPASRIGSVSPVSRSPATSAFPPHTSPTNASSSAGATDSASDSTLVGTAAANGDTDMSSGSISSRALVSTRRPVLDPRNTPTVEEERDGRATDAPTDEEYEDEDDEPNDDVFALDEDLEQEVLPVGADGTSSATSTTHRARSKSSRIKAEEEEEDDDQPQARRRSGEPSGDTATSTKSGATAAIAMAPRKPSRDRADSKEEFRFLSTSVPIAIPLPLTKHRTRGGQDNTATAAAPQAAPVPAPTATSTAAQPSASEAASSSSTSASKTRLFRSRSRAEPEEDEDEAEVSTEGNEDEEEDESISEDEERQNRRRGKSKEFMPPHTLVEEPFWSFAKVKYVRQPDRTGSPFNASAGGSRTESPSNAHHSPSSSSTVPRNGIPIAKVNVPSSQSAGGPSLLARSLR